MISEFHSKELRKIKEKNQISQINTLSYSFERNMSIKQTNSMGILLAQFEK